MKGMANAGAVTDTAEFDAFGKVVARTGTNATQKGFASGHGYQEDGESGYKLLGHRYYDADTGRFLSRDPIGSGRNWYAYCDNSPLKAVDAEGLAWIVLCVDQRGIGHAWVMIIWDNGEVWIMENVMTGDDYHPANTNLYKSGISNDTEAIDSFDTRADYEYWHEFDESQTTRQDVRGAFERRPKEYHLLTNPCHLFAIMLFQDITGTFFYAFTPFEVGISIAEENDQGKGVRPKKFGGRKSIGRGVRKGGKGMFSNPGGIAGGIRRPNPSSLGRGN
jgi:RHS repeat-associated protein